MKLGNTHNANGRRIHKERHQAAYGWVPDEVLNARVQPPAKPRGDGFVWADVGESQAFASYKKTVKVSGAWTEGKSKVRKRLNSCFRFLSLSLRPLPKTYDSTYSECYSLSLVHFVRYRTYYGWAKIYHIFGTNKKMRKLLLKRTFSLCRHEESRLIVHNQKNQLRSILCPLTYPEFDLWNN